MTLPTPFQPNLVLFQRPSDALPTGFQRHSNAFQRPSHTPPHTPPGSEAPTLGAGAPGQGIRPPEKRNRKLGLM